MHPTRALPDLLRLSRPDGPATLKTPFTLMLLLGVCGCATPPLSEYQRQAAGDAQARANISEQASRIRSGKELHTAAEVLPLVQGEMDEAAVTRVALINNPGLALQYANLGIARSALLRAARPPNPTVEASARFGDNHTDAVDIKALQDIVELALLPRRKHSAERELDATKDRLTAKIMGTALEARSAFAEYQTALALADTKRLAADCREAAADVARRMTDAGTMTVLERAAFEQGYHAARLDLAAWQVQLQTKREAVNRVMGLHEDTSWTAKPADGMPDVSGTPKTGVDLAALNANLELSAQRNELEALAQQRGIINTKAYLPELRVGVDSERASDGSWAVGPALVLTLPLFDQGQGQRAAVDFQIQAAWNRYAETAVAIASAARAAADRLDAAEQSLKIQREEVLPLSEKSLKETLLQYNGMLVGVFDLLRAKERQIEAAAHLTETAQECRLSHLALQHALAGGSPMAVTPPALPAQGQGDGGKDGH